MYENSYGVPDTLPTGYGNDLGKADVVRLNDLRAGPARQQMQKRAQMRQLVAPTPPPGFHEMQHVPGVLKLSDVEHEFDDPYEEVYEYGDQQFDDACDYGYEYFDGYGGFGAAAEGPPVRRDKKLKLNYRVLDTRAEDGYMYRQYSDGTYAITAGAVPKGVTLNVPFTPEQNPNAFAAIKIKVEEAIGPFPSGAKPSKPSKKKGKRKKDKAKGKKKIDVGKLAQKGLEAAGAAAKKFKESGKASEPAEGAEDEGPTPGASAPTDDGLPWYAKRVFGLPMWGVIAGGVVLVGGLWYATRNPSVPVAPLPPVAPPPPRQIKAKPAAAQIAAAPPAALEDED